MTSLLLNPSDLDLLIRDHQARLEVPAHVAAPRDGLRVAIGRGLVAAGLAIGGDRPQPAPRQTRSRGRKPARASTS